MKRVGFSGGSAVLTGGAFVRIDLTSGVFDAAAQPVPLLPLLDRIEIGLSGLAAPNMMVEVFLTYDVAGDDIASNLTDPAFDIVRGVTTTTDGGVVVPLGGYLDMRRAGVVVGQISAWVQVDGAGNPAAVARMFWIDEAP